MFTSGCPFKDVPEGLYKMWEIPLVLRTAPVPAWVTVPGDDPRIHYDGAWHGGDATIAALHPQTRYTQDSGASAEFKFSGTGIALVGEKGPEFGGAEIFIDGQRKAALGLTTENFPRISSVELFAVTDLDRGAHTFRLVNTGDMGSVALEALRVIV
jgi:hypothetical protein